MKHLILALALILPLSMGAYDLEHPERLLETSEHQKQLNGAFLGVGT